MKIQYVITLLFSVLLCQSNHSKTNFLQNETELTSNSFGFFEKKVKDPDLKPNQVEYYARLWLQKAKDEHNERQIFNAYKVLMYKDNKEYLLQYADSLVYIATKLNDIELMGSAFLTKGIVYYDQKELQKALDNFIEADKYISQTKNQYNIYKLKYAVAQTKYYLGYYHDAVALLNQCELYFSNENDRAYLSTLHSLALCYTKLKNYDKSTYYTHLGLQEAKDIENEKMLIYFRHAEAVNQHHLKNYNRAINELQLVIPMLHQYGDFSNETIANFYIGKSFWALNQQAKAVEFFIKVDEVYDKNDYLKPELKENYELLAQYFEHRDQQLFSKYIKKLVAIDKVLSEKYAYLSTKIYKGYDTSGHMRAQDKLGKENQRAYIFLAVALLVVLFLVFRHFVNKKRFLKKFQQVMDADTTSSNNNRKKVDSGSIGIKQEVIDIVLEKLENFERSKKFLENDINLVHISSYLGINGKYASQIILHSRGKKIVPYINDLKIEHLIQTLTSDKDARKFNYDGLVEEVGFKSVQNFMRAFKSYTEMTPIQFIKLLDEKDKGDKK